MNKSYRNILENCLVGPGGLEPPVQLRRGVTDPAATSYRLRPQFTIFDRVRHRPVSIRAKQ